MQYFESVKPKPYVEFDKRGDMGLETHLGVDMHVDTPQQMHEKRLLRPGRVHVRS